jgi:hypothetical protein
MTARIDDDVDGWRSAGRARPHPLRAPLVVSLTSYPGRFPTLDRTIASLLRQTVQPDRLVLWVSESALADLPRETTMLQRWGLDIQGVPDLGPYTKLIWSLRAFPDAFLVTADDDAYYDPSWLESLVAEHVDSQPCVLCRRAHRLKLRPDGGIVPYASWEWDVQDAASRLPSRDLFPTGVGGVLYPPGSLHPEVQNEDAFRSLCPTNDDIWFYWMARLAGSSARKVGPRFAAVSWPGSQRGGLAGGNIGTHNDAYIRALIERYGMPEAVRQPAVAASAADHLD